MNINWIGLNDADRRTILEQTSVRTGYIVQAVEKDWWVTTVLEALFSLPFGNQLSFKGGTSLSKCWGLINRFSEDIDIAVTREQLGFTGILSKNQINDRVRRALCSFVREELPERIDNMLLAMGIPREWFRTEVIRTPLPEDPQDFPTTHQLCRKYNTCSYLFTMCLQYMISIFAPFRSKSCVRTSLRTFTFHSAFIL